MRTLVQTNYEGKGFIPDADALIFMFMLIIFKGIYSIETTFWQVFDFTFCLSFACWPFSFNTCD